MQVAMMEIWLGSAHTMYELCGEGGGFIGTNVDIHTYTNTHTYTHTVTETCIPSGSSKLTAILHCK